jgi:RNA polymerase sigma-70 factor (ECF subfamily)
MEITEVVERILSGDTGAFAAVVEAYQGPLFGYLGRMGLPQAQAEEIAQETFLRAWTHLDEFDARRASFDTWLYTIAHRLALNALARHATTRELAITEAHDPPSKTPEPVEALAAAQLGASLRAALLALPAHDRSAIALAYVEDLALADVARIEGCTVGAIKTRLHRARAKLAALMENERPANNSGDRPGIRPDIRPDIRR